MYLAISEDPLRYEPGPPVLPFLTCEQTERVRTVEEEEEEEAGAAEGEKQKQ